MSDEISSSGSVESSGSAETKVDGGANTNPDVKVDAKPEPKVETAPVPKYRKIKVGDSEELVDEEEVWRDVQKYRGADKKFQEAAQIRKQTESFMQALKENPLSILRDPRLGLNLSQLAEQVILDQIEQEKLTPEARRVKELESQLKAREEAENNARQTAEQEKFQQEVESHKAILDKTFSEALALTPLSQDPVTAATAIRDMAMFMRSAREAGIDVTPQEIAQHVNQKYYKAMVGLANKHSAEDLVKILGEDVVNKIRKYDLDRLRAGRQQSGSQEHKQPVNRDQKQQKITAFDMRVNPNDVKW